MAAVGGRRKADLKVVILGVQDIGKTALISRYIEGKFSLPAEQTIGASFSLKKWGPYNVAIWDTAGGERFMGLSSFYCRGAGAAILAYDLKDEDSFSAIRTRFVPLLQSAEPDCLCVVVGTKSDLLHDQSNSSTQMNQSNTAANHSDQSNDDITRVPVDQAIRLAKELNNSRHFDTEVPYFETSSKENINVDNVFEYIFRTALPIDKVDEIRAKRSGSAMELNEKKSAEKGGKSQKKCCQG